MHRIARSTRAVGFIPYEISGHLQHPFEHFQRRWLGVTRMEPPCSDILIERTGELAFDSGEDTACLILEMGAVVHAGLDSIKRGSVHAASSVVSL